MKFDSYSFKIRQLNSNVNDMRNELKDLKHKQDTTLPFDISTVKNKTNILKQSQSDSNLRKNIIETYLEPTKNINDVFMNNYNYDFNGIKKLKELNNSKSRDYNINTDKIFFNNTTNYSNNGYYNNTNNANTNNNRIKYTSLIDFSKGLCINSDLEKNGDQYISNTPFFSNNKDIKDNNFNYEYDHVRNKPFEKQRVIKTNNNSHSKDSNLISDNNHNNSNNNDSNDDCNVKNRSPYVINNKDLNSNDDKYYNSSSNQIQALSKEIEELNKNIKSNTLSSNTYNTNIKTNTNSAYPMFNYDYKNTLSTAEQLNLNPLLTDKDVHELINESYKAQTSSQLNYLNNNDTKNISENDNYTKKKQLSLIDFNKGASFANAFNNLTNNELKSTNNNVSNSNEIMKTLENKEYHNNMKKRLETCETQINEMLIEVELLNKENKQLKSKLEESENELVIYKNKYLNFLNNNNNGNQDQNDDTRNKNVNDKKEYSSMYINNKSNNKDKYYYNYGDINSIQVINEITEGPFETSEENFNKINNSKNNYQDTQQQNSFKRSNTSFNNNNTNNNILSSHQIEDLKTITNLKSLFNTNSNEFLTREIDDLLDIKKENSLYNDLVKKITELFIKLTDSNVIDKSKKPEIKVVWRWIKEIVQKFRETALSYQIEKNKVRSILEYLDTIGLGEKKNTIIKELEQKYCNINESKGSNLIDINNMNNKTRNIRTHGGSTYIGTIDKINNRNISDNNYNFSGINNFDSFGLSYISNSNVNKKNNNKCSSCKCNIQNNEAIINDNYDEYTLRNMNINNNDNNNSNNNQFQEFCTNIMKQNNIKDFSSLEKYLNKLIDSNKKNKLEKEKIRNIIGIKSRSKSKYT